MWLSFFSFLILFGLTRFGPHFAVMAWVFQWSELICFFTENCKYKTYNKYLELCVWEGPHPHQLCIYLIYLCRQTWASFYLPESHSLLKIWLQLSCLTSWECQHDDTTWLEPFTYTWATLAHTGSNNDKLIPSGADESFVLCWQFNRASIMLIWYQRLESSPWL